ncbi:MAG: DUF4377 domain-containing protein [Cryomorphaceae bacterium]
MKTIATALILFWNGILYGQAVELKTITVNPYLSFQNYEHFKRLTLSSPDSDAEYIEDFQFKWGYSYKLSVKETKLPSILSDGTRYSYSLENVISQTEESDTAQFQLFLDGNRYYDEMDSSEQELNRTFHQMNDSTFRYFDEVEIEVPAHFMEKFKSIVEGRTSTLGTFLYVDEKRIRLIKI